MHFWICLGSTTCAWDTPLEYPACVSCFPFFRPVGLEETELNVGGSAESRLRVLSCLGLCSSSSSGSGSGSGWS